MHHSRAGGHINGAIMGAMCYTFLMPTPLPQIHRYRRLGGYDYSRGAALFITISTEPRRQCFGIVRNANVELT